VEKYTSRAVRTNMHPLNARTQALFEVVIPLSKYCLAITTALSSQVKYNRRQTWNYLHGGIDTAVGAILTPCDSK